MVMSANPLISNGRSKLAMPRTSISQGPLWLDNRCNANDSVGYQASVGTSSGCVALTTIEYCLAGGVAAEAVASITGTNIEFFEPMSLNPAVPFPMLLLPRLLVPTAPVPEMLVPVELVPVVLAPTELAAGTAEFAGRLESGRDEASSFSMSEFDG